MAAPMAGPYALKAMADGVLSQEKLSVPSFMANVGYAYAKAKDEELNSVINEPYASALPTLFSGDLTRAEIDPKLTNDTTGKNGLFNPSFVTDYFATEDNWFKVATTNNSLQNWAPTTPVRLVHCEGDDVIPYGISQLTEATMTAMGANDVALVPVEKALGLNIKVGHGTCGTMAYAVTAMMFADVRKKYIGY